METRYFKTLVTAVEAGTFSRAAEILHITQSAVSQRIKFLEEQYGRPLLDRSGPVLAPTEAGRLVLKNARSILEREQEMLQELKRLGGEKRLSFCCTPTFGMAFLPRVFNHFLLEHADLTDLKFVFHQPQRALKGLQEKEFDLAVIEHCCGVDFSPFRVHSLMKDELVLISAPTLGIPPGEAAIHPFLPHRLYARRDGCSSKQLLEQNLSSQGLHFTDFRGVVISDDLRLTVAAVLAGNGISFISRSLVEEYLKAGRLVAHHVRGFEHFRSRSIVVPCTGENDPIIQAFIKAVLKVGETFAQPERLCIPAGSIPG